MEDLKHAEDTRTKQQVGQLQCSWSPRSLTFLQRKKVLAEVQRIMLQDDHTKDVFRELDGFLILMSLLSNIEDRPHKGIVEPEEQVLLDALETIRLVFANLAEAMNEHLENSEYFRVRCRLITSSSSD